MKRSYLIQINNGISSYTITEKQHAGTKHLVVPVTMIVQGVLPGSLGPLLHLAEDFGKFPESWNGIPVVINHPQINGKNVSANISTIIDTGCVGRIYNTFVTEGTPPELKAECWLEETKLSTISIDTYNAVKKGQPIEVSVGVFTENEPEEGEYSGIQYNAIARNHRPDHLALLPGGVGACSLADGCGIHANEKKGVNNVKDLQEAIEIINAKGLKVYPIVDNSESGLKEKLDDLRDLVYSLNNPNPSSDMNSDVYNYLEEAFDDYLIYETNGKDNEKYFKRNYQIRADNGMPEFTGDPVEVVKKIEYKNVVVANVFKRTKESKSMSEKCTPCVAKKASELIANTNTKFTEDNRVWLESLELDVLESLEPNTISTNAVAEPKIAKLSKDDQAALDYGKRMLQERKDTMKKGITDNTDEGVWDELVLNEMSVEMLERVYKSVSKEKQADYSLNGNFVERIAVNTKAKHEPMYFGGVEVK